MNLRKFKFSSLVFILLLTLSGLSFGFLVGRSHQAQAEMNNTTQQMKMMGEKVQASGALVSRGADAVRKLLIK